MDDTDTHGDRGGASDDSGAGLGIAPYREMTQTDTLPEFGEGGEGGFG